MPASAPRSNGRVGLDAAVDVRAAVRRRAHPSVQPPPLDVRDQRAAARHHARSRPSASPFGDGERAAVERPAAAPSPATAAADRGSTRPRPTPSVPPKCPELAKPSSDLVLALDERARGQRAPSTVCQPSASGIAGDAWPLRGRAHRLLDRRLQAQRHACRRWPARAVSGTSSTAWVCASATCLPSSAWRSFQVGERPREVDVAGEARRAGRRSRAPPARSACASVRLATRSKTGCAARAAGVRQSDGHSDVEQVSVRTRASVASPARARGKSCRRPGAAAH